MRGIKEVHKRLKAKRRALIRWDTARQEAEKALKDNPTDKHQKGFLTEASRTLESIGRDMKRLERQAIRSLSLEYS